MQVADNKYVFSFTAVSMRLSEMIGVARYLQENNFPDWENITDYEAVFGSAKEKTSIRKFRELVSRVYKLNEEQIDLLIAGDLNAQKQIAFLSICKLYDFIHEFTVEVVRDKFLVFDYHINEGDYRSFFNRKLELHPELDELAETTRKKIRQVMFLMLEEADLIDSTRTLNIQPQLLSEEVIRAILRDDPAWLRIFLYSDTDIKRLSS
jgi:hypothetical protein